MVIYFTQISMSGKAMGMSENILGYIEKQTDKLFSDYLRKLCLSLGHEAMNTKVTY